MKKILTMLLFILLVSTFLCGCSLTIDRGDKIIKKVEKTKDYGYDITIKFINDRGTIEEKGKGIFSKEKENVVNLENGKTIIWTGEKVFIKNNKNGNNYTEEQGVDAVYRYIFPKDYIKKIKARDGKKYFFKTNGGKEYLIVEIFIPSENKNIYRGIMYIDVSSYLPEKIKILDKQGKDRVVVEYQNFKCSRWKESEVLQMFNNYRPVWAEINLNNATHNMEEIRRITKSKEIIAVIKGDAYGHGALDLAPTLLESGATRLAVAVLSEAIELRKGNIKCPIMILGFTPGNFSEELVEFDIEQTVYDYKLALDISKEAVKQGKMAKIHIAVDTGMGRIGFIPNEESIDEVYKISKLPNMIIEGLFSHFSAADEKDKSYALEQLKEFNDFYDLLIKKGVKINIKHIANSAAIIDLPEMHFDAVRPGIILYGYYPSKQVNTGNIDLKPVMTVKANIVHIKQVPAGKYISYGRKFETSRSSVIGTIPVGYADGYTRLLFNKAKVIVNGMLAPVVGRICMDQCMVDLTDAGDVQVGDEVILLGEDNGVKFNGDDVAELLNTISYEVTCSVGKRVPRVYVKDGKIIKIRNYV